MRWTVREDLRVEAIDGGLVILDAGGGAVHTLVGDRVDAYRLVEAGESVPSRLTPALETLQDAGLVESGGWTRRKALLAGGVGLATATTGFFSMELPAAAAASSCMNAGADTLASIGTNGDDLMTTRTINFGDAGGSMGVHTFKTGTMVSMVTVAVWGGGGSGGNDATSDFGFTGFSGGGGAGASFIQTTINVAACTTYTVTIGDGGVGNAGATMSGGASTFSGPVGSPVITVTAPGGGNGGNATSSAVGAGGTAGAVGSITLGSGASTTATAGGMGGNGFTQFLDADAGGGGGGGAGGSGTGTAGGPGQDEDPGAGGAGGGLGAGAGGNGGDEDNNPASVTGFVPGGGGGGAGSGGDGAAGGQGRVTITNVP